MERRLLEHQGSARCEQLGGFYRAKEDFNCNKAVVSYLRKKGDSHESYDNLAGNSAHSHKYTRAGASPRANPRNGRIRISRAAFSGFVPRYGGFDKCSSYLEEPRPRSDSAEQHHFCSDACPNSDSWRVRGSQVEENPAT